MIKKTLSKLNQTPLEDKKVLKPSVVLFTWEAPERLFKTKSREYYRRLAVIIIFFSLLALVTKDIPMVLILGVSFFAIYIFHTIPPRKVTHKVTTRGINYASEFLYAWDILIDFWIEKKDGVNVLYVNTEQALPGRISLILADSVDVKKLTKEINNYISINEDPVRPAVGGLLEKISSKINFD